MRIFFTHLVAVPWERIGLVLLIFTIPLSLRNVLSSSSPTGTFNEYTDISIYASDIALGLFLAGITLRYIRINKSSIKSLFHVEHLFLALFLFWTVGTIFWAPHLPLALFSFGKVAEGALLFIMLYLVLRLPIDSSLFHVERVAIASVPRGTNIFPSKSFHVEHFFKKLSFNCSTWSNLELLWFSWFFSAFIQSIVGILQFISQKSLGLFFLGESYLSTDKPGVAEVIIGPESLMRAYGLFPHPNAFGGYLLISLLITLIIPSFYPHFMFHVEQKRIKYLFLTGVAIIFLALLLTFSKAALAGCLIMLILLYQRGKKMFHVEHLTLFISAILFISASFWWINREYYWVQPLKERILHLSALKNFSLSDYFFGTGIGQTVNLLQNYLSVPLEPWQYQPMHNFFIHIFSEIGVIGIIFFVVFCVASLFTFHVERTQARSVPRGTKFLPVLFFLPLLPPLLFDHYFWTLQQGILSFWFFLALCGNLTKYGKLS